MNKLIKHLEQILEEEKQEVVGYIKDRPAIIGDIVQIEILDNPEFTEDDISDEFMLEWIETIETSDDYDNSIYDAAYLHWYETAIRHMKDYFLTNNTL